MQVVNENLLKYFDFYWKYYIFVRFKFYCYFINSFINSLINDQKFNKFCLNMSYLFQKF
jgi:hypothetical protein